MKENILIVDDAEFSRSVIKQALNNAGFDNIFEATSADEARKFFAANGSPDLTILDIMLPDCCDLSLLKELTSTYANTKVVLNSAIAKPEITREALEAGAKGFITKPFNETEFLCKVRLALED